MLQARDRTPGTHPQAAQPLRAHGVKPRLRGWSHAFAAIGAVIVTIGLSVATRDDRLRWLSVLTFGVTMIELYMVSAIYHLGSWRGRSYTVLRTLDHANIFLVIAGTYTPICINVLHGELRLVVLTLIWALALLGACGTIVLLRLPRWVPTTLYAAMGLISVIALPNLMTLLPWQALALFFAGGLLYAIGALVYALRRPDPLPHMFGFHEIFHLLVIGGNAAFVIVIWIWVVPFPRI
ncbi:MAG TPA: hemolysin III family protein [Herpetosiphonaceae bacterium]